MIYIIEYESLVHKFLTRSMNQEPKKINANHVEGIFK
jgi:hypothetical protein